MWLFVTVLGREFQIVGPATLNPREPKQVRTTRVMSLWALEERRVRVGLYDCMSEEQIWRGSWVKGFVCKQGYLVLYAIWDRKPMEVFQQMVLYWCEARSDLLPVRDCPAEVEETAGIIYERFPVFKYFIYFLFYSFTKHAGRTVKSKLITVALDFRTFRKRMCHIRICNAYLISTIKIIIYEMKHEVIISKLRSTVRDIELNIHQRHILKYVICSLYVGVCCWFPLQKVFGWWLLLR